MAVIEERKDRLSATGLVKIYGKRRVVNNVSIYLESGEVVGLLGPNGAGKTTTFYMIVGLIRENGGTIMLNGEDITELPMYLRARMGIGYLQQESSIFRGLKVWENIYSVFEMKGFSKKEGMAKTEELLEKYSIAHIKNSMGANLSGGERRRVEIARIMATSPRFLLLDEPFTGIDPIVRADLQEIILCLKDEDIGILITDHNVRETLEITDRSYIMYEGKILINGETNMLVNDEEVREKYLGKRFKL
ncbi:LPS export ABC transporter ATP-binding protein [candidate division WOR-3 bacterium]|uniref:LPS export ABC transporter ATP-binding protein n=1 Tax=candidate division TA06 bacterium TaxID=2250710 RepID=A0A660S643_UNCT6|nr:LPS export ABC transporter ATP-binding protein [candidate division WOR-3 bacterium]RKX65254.1 MAG: LPS export ABC transporter ATP-binding protein [candidate division TA06 bacterium]